jgi:hypothetical protein
MFRSGGKLVLFWEREGCYGTRPRYRGRIGPSGPSRAPPGPSFYLSPDTPFGGYGISGVGREHGIDGFKEYLQAKTIASPAG